MSERRVLHRLPAGTAPRASAALAQLFGVALLEALQARRCGPAAGVAQEHKEAGRGTPVSRI